MKKIILFFLGCLAANIYAERVEPIPFGDMESWTVRYIEESKLLGGQTKTLYCLAPTDTIWENGPYTYGQDGNPWSTSNAYANIIGIEKAAGTMAPEAREDGGTCCRMDVDMLGVRVMGMIDIEVLVAGTMFTGRTIEPITTAKDPYRNIDFGVPFTGRPTALMFDYKCIVSPEDWVWYAKGTAKPKKQEGHDEAEAYVYLQHRWEDEKGHIHSIRVGTGYKRFSEDQLTWVNGYRLPIHYGDITGEEWYEDYMGFKGIQRAMNSRGKMTLIQEEGWDGTLEPTHLVIMLTSGKYEAFVGKEGNVLWVDNVNLVYEE
ncbi:MAG: PCMD domain-containing protein [Paludibacteraceae bacterium]|nr:PCMD domain-containing protein [Paludibacteraceae bacterium]